MASDAEKQKNPAKHKSWFKFLIFQVLWISFRFVYFLYSKVLKHFNFSGSPLWNCNVCSHLRGCKICAERYLRPCPQHKSYSWHGKRQKSVANVRAGSETRISDNQCLITIIQLSKAKPFIMPWLSLYRSKSPMLFAIHLKPPKKHIFICRPTINKYVTI